MSASNVKQMFCVRLLTSDNQNQCRNKMAAYAVDYFRLNYCPLRTKTHEIKRATIVTTYSYLLTNLVSNFHVKFHQNQLKLSFYQHDLLRINLNDAAWSHGQSAFFRGKQLDQTTAYSFSPGISANSSEIFGFRIFAE